MCYAKPLNREEKSSVWRVALQKSRSKKALGLAAFHADAHLSIDRRKSQAETGEEEKQFAPTDAASREKRLSHQNSQCQSLGNRTPPTLFFTKQGF